MKQKLKETIVNYLILFCIGGILGIIYGLFSGAYCCIKGLMLAKCVLKIFTLSGVILVIFIAVISVIVVSLHVIFTWLKSKLLK